MKYYDHYTQKNWAEIQSLMDHVPFCQLLTVSGAGEVKIGIFNPFVEGQKIFLHLSRHDEQVKALREGAQVKVIFQDFLALIPSHWVDAMYAGAATAYYRYAEFDCRAVVTSDSERLQFVLQKLMDRFQPDGGYEPLSAASDTYSGSYQELVAVELDITGQRTKWKLGQNRPPEVRKKVAEQLRQRARGEDLRAAFEVLKTVD